MAAPRLNASSSTKDSAVSTSSFQAADIIFLISADQQAAEMFVQPWPTRTADGNRSCGQVCAENTAGQAAERYTYRTAYEIRVGHQPQNCQGHRPDYSRNILRRVDVLIE